MEDSGAASINYSRNTRRSDGGNDNALVPNVSEHDKTDVTYQIVTNYADISSHGSSLRFFYANVRSICKEGKFNEIKWISEHMSEPIHLLIFTETWIKKEANIDLYQLSNYDHVYNRRGGRGGGVSIYIYNGIKYDVQEEMRKGGNHYLWINLKELSLVVGVIYRHGGSVNKFLNEYLPQLQARSEQRTIVFGDFNINLLQPEKSEVRSYLNGVKETGFIILNKIDKSYTTRDTPKTRKLIDHVCTNINDYSYSMTIIDSCLSDHKQIFLQIKMNKEIKINKKIHKVLDYNRLYESTSQIEYNNKDCDYDHLKRFISEQIRKNIKYQEKNPPQDHVHCIYDAINSRNVLGQKKKFCPEETTKVEYKKAIESVMSLIKVDLVSYRFKNCNNDPKKLLRLIDQLACAKKGSNSKCIIDDNLCESLNYKLSNIGEDLGKKISQKYCTGNKKYTLMYDDNYIHSTTLNELSLFSNEEISKIIDNLDCNTSTGFDGIGVKAIKCLKDLMIDSLTNCLNKCLTNGTFPDDLKVAKVRPIYQSGCTTNLDSFQWVTVLPVFSKIFERAVHKRLNNYLSEKNFLTDAQYDSRSNSSALSAAVDLITEIKCRIDQKNIVLGIFIDLKYAFYSVCHQKMLQKLENIGVRGTAYNLFSSYLENRKQFVQKGASKSSTKILSYGCPQDSVIGRLLFSIYANNISNIRLEGYLTLYSDKISLLYYNESIDNIITDAQRDLNRLNKWLKYNNLTINMAATSYMIFAAKNKKIPKFVKLEINNETIKKSSVIEYHRLFIDNKLNWKQHIDYIQSELKLLSDKLNKIADRIPKEMGIVVYNSLVKPHLEYLIEIWGTCSKTPKNLKLLQNTQNKIIKILNLESKLLNINQLYVYDICILVRHILSKYIYSRLLLHKKSVSYDLRNIDDLELISARTDYGKKTILFEGAQLYNKLPSDIKSCDDIDTFKIKLEEYVLRLGMLKHVAVSPHRARADSVSLASSASCCSLGSLEHRHDSVGDLSHRTTTIKVYARRLRPDIEYKTLSVTWGTCAREVVATLLGKFRMRHRDPRLFYLSMEVRVRAAGLKTTLVLDDDARPAALQACHPKGYSKFSLQMRPGGLIKIYDSALMSSSQYKCLLTSEQTTVDEVLAILLHCYDSNEGVERFSLYEVCPSQEYERKLHADDLPLTVQRKWPSDSDCHFRVRRNPRAPPLPPRTLPPPEETPSEDDEPSRALSALSLEAEGEKRRYSPVYKFPSISYCRETKNDYLYI